MQCIEQIQGQRGDGDWWSSINWAAVTREVRRLQGRIYRASEKGDVKGAMSLMKLLARSRLAKLLAIYRVTQRNKGRITPGIDGKKYLSPEARMELSKENFNYATYKTQPALRRLIPKSTLTRTKRTCSRKSRNRAVKMRPLGVMTIKDRVMMTILSLALEARWEPIFEPNVMGYRLGRCPQDAIKVIHQNLQKESIWILDADIKGFFDNILHESIMPRLCCFKKLILQSLECGIVDRGKKSPTRRGIIQGNPLSPILANIALHDMEALFKNDKDIHVVRFADDFVALAPSEERIRKRIVPTLRRYLDARGLSFNLEKTRAVTKQHGFDFLGFTIKQPRQKLYVLPRRKKLLEFLRRFRDFVWSNKELRQDLLIAKLNLKISGWTRYYRYCDSGKSFNFVDSEIWKVLWRWVCRKHKKKKTKAWIIYKYFDTTSGKGWVFRDKKTGYKLKRATDTKRETYRFTVGALSPLDPSPTSREAWESKQLLPQAPMQSELKG